MIGNDTWMIVGKLVSPHGLRGEIKINPKSDFPERFTQPGKRWLQKTKGHSPYEIELLSGRKLPGKEVFIVRFEGINNRTEAESLIGNNLLVPMSQRPKLAKGEFHLLDLVGLEARLGPDQTAIGTVTDLNSAGNDLLEIKLIEGRKVLIPLVKEIVPLIKVSEGWLLITPPKGLLEL